MKDGWKKDRWIDGRKDGWMDESMNGRKERLILLHKQMPSRLDN